MKNWYIYERRSGKKPKQKWVSVSHTSLFFISLSLQISSFYALFILHAHQNILFLTVTARTQPHTYRLIFHATWQWQWPAKQVYFVNQEYRDENRKRKKSWCNRGNTIARVRSSESRSSMIPWSFLSKFKLVQVAGSFQSFQDYISTCRRLTYSLKTHVIRATFNVTLW